MVMELQPERFETHQHVYMAGEASILAKALGQPADHSKSNPEDVNFWSSHLIPLFQKYLSEAGSYTDEQQASHVACLRAVLGALGPKPPHPHVKPALTHNGLPFELSINLSEGKAPTARFYIEPLGPQTGTDEDPFGDACLPSCFASLAAQMTSVDASWYQHLNQAFMVKGQEEFSTAKGQSRPGVWIPKAFMGVDFVGPDRFLKCSFCPLRKFSATKADQDPAKCTNMVLDVVRQLPGGRVALGPALDILEQYLDRGSVQDGRADTRCRACAEKNRLRSNFNLVNVDCTDPTSGKSRVKLYVRIQCYSFACVRDAITLGGRLNDADTLEGLRRLQSIWHLLLNDPACKQDEQYSRPVAVEQVRQGIDINWEISGQMTVPETKVYVPICLTHANDIEVIHNLNNAFSKLNWHEWAEGRYAKMFYRSLYAFFHVSLLDRIQTDIKYSREADFGTSHIHTWVSFCYYQRRGSYMTIYHSPPL